MYLTSAAVDGDTHDPARHVRTRAWAANARRFMAAPLSVPRHSHASNVAPRPSARVNLRSGFPQFFLCGPGTPGVDERAGGHEWNAGVRYVFEDFSLDTDRCELRRDGRLVPIDRKSTQLNSSHRTQSRVPSAARKKK